MSDDLRWSWYSNNRNKVYNKCHVLESSSNHPLVPGPWKKCLLQNCPGSKKVGDHCLWLSIFVHSYRWVPLNFAKSFMVLQNIVLSILEALLFSGKTVGGILKLSEILIKGLIATCMLSCSVMSDFLQLYGLPRSSVHGIFQVRILEWVAISSSRRSLQPINRTEVSCKSPTLQVGFFTAEPLRLDLIFTLAAPWTWSSSWIHFLLGQILDPWRN